MTGDFGISKPTKILMGSVGLDDTLDSLEKSYKEEVGLNSEESLQNSPNSYASDPEAEDTNNLATKLTLLDLLLTQLQSQLAELKNAGVGVRMFQKGEGVGILLEGVKRCAEHHIMHSMAGCPLCPALEKATSLLAVVAVGVME